MARANTAENEGIVWDTPGDDEGIVWDTPKPQNPPMGAVERFVYGLRAPIDAGTQLGVQANKWLASKGVVPQLPGDPTQGERERKAAYEAGKPEGIDWANLAGTLLSPPNLMMAAVPAATIPRALAAGAASGALTPADEGDNFWGDKVKQALVGAAGAGALNVAGRTLARVASPNASHNPDLQLLRGEGVRPTIGQALGGRWNALEEKLQSLPLTGDMIALARGRSRDDFNRAAINRTVAPIGQRATGAGQEAVADAGDRLGAVYDQARTLAQGRARLDRPGIADIRTVMDDVSRMPEREQQAFRGILDTIGTDFTPTGRIADFKRVDSFLGNRAANFQGGSDPYARDLGDAIGQLQAGIRGSVMRRAPDASALNTAADQGWANLVRVENAAAAAKGTGGVFTPGQLLQGVRQADKSVRDRATARGEALMQDLGTAGQNVIGNKVPDSGTAGRLLPWSILSGGAGFGAMAAPGTTAAVLAGLGTGAVAYTPQVQRMLVAMVANRSPGWQQAAQYLRAFAEHSAPAGAQTATGLLD